MSMQKRQREIKKAEKAAQKRAKRHGFVLERPAEPVPSMGADVLFGPNPPESPEGPEATEVEASAEPSPEEETEKEEAEDQT
jgi:hypothetical protein